ncbi:MAG: phosphoesterase, partial [Acidobacteria bacterium]|nr:phosphoesterase [Acidobacteriota bacterium]
MARTNSYPAAIALSADGRYAAFLNQGYGTQESRMRQSISILDLRNNQLRDFPDNRLRADEKTTQQSYFLGLGFSSDGKHLYASMGSATQNGIATYQFSSGNITPERFITIPAQRVPPGKTLVLDSGNRPRATGPAYPAGFVVLNSKHGDHLLIANNLSDNVIILDVVSGRIVKSFDLSTSKYVPAVYPYAVIANRARTKAWVSLWNGSAVAELDLKKGRLTRLIELWRSSDPVSAGTHPTAMLLNRAEDTLYVAISNANTSKADGVAAVDLKSGRPRLCYRATLNRSDEPGAASIAIALSGDEQHLYVAAASLNAVAVFETKGPSSDAEVQLPQGFVPTEWYPSALAVAGNDLLIASAKGESSGPNHMKAAVQTVHSSPHPYIATLIGGCIQRLSFADIKTNLAAFTRQVEENNLAAAPPEKIQFASGSNPIKHVIYILKENRTYDQIFGDLGVGDGDPSLTLYGVDVTPNQHKLALQFGVLDNFYDSGDVSANGHLWSDASATSDFIEKIWPIIYRGSERPMDQGNSLDQNLPLMDDPGTGFLWDNLAKHNFSYRIYGEMVDAAWCKDQKALSPRKRTPSISAACPSAEINPGEALPPSLSNPNGGPSPWPWPIPRLKTIRPTKEAQRDHIDPLYADFAIDYPDQLRADEFLREFNEWKNPHGSAQELPQFIEMWLPADHIGGTRVGKPTPRASVADNDLAVGRVVDAISHSRYWNDTAIFVVEDDAQDGADHVDAHRSTALVISKYSPSSGAPFVDHHFYTTAGMVHTMEELLGLPPMNLFDAHAPVIAAPFSGPGKQPPFQSDDKNLR